MANENKLFKRCEACSGNGTIKQLNTTSNPYGEGWVDVTCSRCLGSGTLPSGKSTLPDHYFLARDVYACMTYMEWWGLDALAKELLHLTLSLGVLNLSPGSPELGALNTIFGEGTTTHTNIAALVA